MTKQFDKAALDELDRLGKEAAKRNATDRVVLEQLMCAKFGHLCDSHDLAEFVAEVAGWAWEERGRRAEATERELQAEVDRLKAELAKYRQEQEHSQAVGLGLRNQLDDIYGALRNYAMNGSDAAKQIAGIYSDLDLVTREARELRAENEKLKSEFAKYQQEHETWDREVIIADTMVSAICLECGAITRIPKSKLLVEFKCHGCGCLLVASKVASKA